MIIENTNGSPITCFSHDQSGLERLILFCLSEGNFAKFVLRVDSQNVSDNSFVMNS